MDFKNRLNHSDVNQFLSDSQTLCREDYFRNKFNDKLPEYMYYALEVFTRLEYDNVDEQEVIECINDFKLEYHNKLMLELNERQNIKPDVVIIPDEK